MIISFQGYKSPIKTMWRRGELPKVRYGLYGDRLTSSNISADHLVPVSLGGKTTLGNIALASKRANEMRGNKPLKDFVTKEMAWNYIGEFYNDQRKVIQEYVKAIYKTFKELGVL